MKKIIVTGGAGYIGSHTVVSLLEQGIEPIIIDDFRNSQPSVIQNLEELTQQKIKNYSVDCTDKHAVYKVFEKEKNVEGVIHFAAYKSVGESVRYPAKYFHNNIHSLTVICEVMKKFDVKNIVFSSSCTVYGQPDGVEVTEESPVKEAASPYGYTKQVCEQLLNYLSENTDFPLRVVLLRYFNPIGAHPSALIGELPLGVPDNLVPFVTQTAAGIREQLTVFGNDYPTGDGTCIRDYIHVCDLADAHVKALSHLENHQPGIEIFNVGTGKGTSVLEIIRIFEEVNGVKLNHKIGSRRPGDVVEIYANVDKIQNELNWSPKYSVEDALKHAWKWEKSLH